MSGIHDLQSPPGMKKIFISLEKISFFLLRILSFSGLLYLTNLVRKFGFGKVKRKDFAIAPFGQEVSHIWLFLRLFL